MINKQYLTKNRDKILELAIHHGINRIRVFDSVSRGEDSSDSDIDFLLKF